jgi:hypothetical protein
MLEIVLGIALADCRNLVPLSFVLLVIVLLFKSTPLVSRGIRDIPYSGVGLPAFDLSLSPERGLEEVSNRS